jgi:hypothetical protein
MRSSIKEPDFNLAIISFYIIFMLSYIWVTEQMFLDPLPFIFLQILFYHPKKTYVYALFGIQLLVFAFMTFNGVPFVFRPLLQEFSPQILNSIEFLDPKYPIIWTIRGVLGLVVSIALCTFLVGLTKPEAFERIHKRLKSTFNRGN